MVDNKDSKRDGRGRFGPGNQAGRKKYRRRRQSTADLIRLANKQLSDLGDNRNVDELIAESACKLLTAAAGGDRQAAIWILDRFYPAESECHSLTEALPSPSKLPLDYLDSLVRAVGDSQLTTGQAARLSQLARPFVIDAELQQLSEQFDDLQRKLDELHRDKLQGAEQ